MCQCNIRKEFFEHGFNKVMEMKYVIAFIQVPANTA